MTMRSLSDRARGALLGLLAAGAALAAAAPAQADHLLTRFEASSSTTQAGAHADVTTSFSVNEDERLKTMRFHLPTGLLGTIANFPTCTVADARKGTCPENTQVGEAMIHLEFNGTEFTTPGKVTNLRPGRGDVALLGIDVLGGVALTLVRLTVRPDDYGLDATIDALPNLVLETDMTLWGVPWDHWSPATRADNPRLPFMVNPSVCGKPGVTTVEVDSYLNPGKFETYTATSPAQTGCESLVFEPRIWARAGNPFVNQPSGFEFGIDIPFSNDADKLGTPPLRDVTAVLPEGLTINPSVATDAAVCRDVDFAQRSAAPAACPGESRVGTVGFRVPALPDPHLTGAIYLGEPRGDDRFRLFLEAYGSNTRVKLTGSIQPDPQTGRLTTVFRDNPEVPVAAIKLAFKGGQRAPLAMPSTCGAKPVTAGISSWGGPAVSTSTLLHVAFDPQGSPCPEALGFAPRFAAGTVNANAGQDAGFTLAFGRGDLDRELGKIDLSLPAGLLGRLTAVPPCSAAAGARGACGDASLVGDARVWAGAGDDPVLVRGGRVYLTEPYREGDVAALSIVVPAVAGPYDLGTAVVRAGIKVRPDTGLDVSAEPLPTIMAGVPLRIRRVQVDLGREGFMFNPSDCSPKRITGTITSTDGVAAEVGSPFRVTGCSKLEFSPSMRIRATKPAADRTLGLHVTVGQDRGEARMRRLTLVLPSGLGSRLDGPIQHACSEEDYQHDRCAEAAKIGSATATTEVLPYGLDAPVYFVANPSGGLPRLGVRLRGGPITVDLLGEVEINAAGRIVTVFDGIPDVPITSFELRLAEGAQAVLTGTEMCARKVADLEVLAHSGAISRQRVPLSVEGCASRSTRVASKRAKAGKRAAKRHERRARR